MLERVPPTLHKGALILMLMILSSSGAFAQEISAAFAKGGSNPNGMYGGCRLPESGFRRKSDHVREAGRNLTNVSTIDVINCRPFDGSGCTFVVACPAGTSFSYCLRNRNDGVGNHIFLGVVVDTTRPSCSVAARLSSPLAQLDITFRDQGSGLSVIEFRGGTTNVQIHMPDLEDSRAPAVMTATKIDQSQPGILDGILVTDDAGNVNTCNFEF
jgi:hypothetical protein